MTTKEWEDALEKKIKKIIDIYKEKILVLEENYNNKIPINTDEIKELREDNMFKKCNDLHDLFFAYNFFIRKYWNSKYKSEDRDIPFPEVDYTDELLKKIENS